MGMPLLQEGEENHIQPHWRNRINISPRDPVFINAKDDSGVCPGRQREIIEGKHQEFIIFLTQCFAVRAVAGQQEEFERLFWSLQSLTTSPSSPVPHHQSLIASPPSPVPHHQSPTTSPPPPIAPSPKSRSLNIDKLLRVWLRVSLRVSLGVSLRVSLRVSLGVSLRVWLRVSLRVSLGGGRRACSSTRPPQAFTTEDNFLDYMQQMNISITSEHDLRASPQSITSEHDLRASPQRGTSARRFLSEWRGGGRRGGGRRGGEAAGGEAARQRAAAPEDVSSLAHRTPDALEG
ncbi:hypothetical protein EYF80_043937 [Liparis tanakae]|uniref:Uncharacterized protein n=1 Tax=Liparis tanakae TaxID=230148 RepID=A0A4Z2FX91_9TELE|nr:hypothetical protein EYF80_043937 [Liparis tanakae]